jgi:hypothetical protein
MSNRFFDPPNVKAVLSKESARDNFAEYLAKNLSPIPCRPREVVDRMRVTELLEAMLRYNNASKKIPNEWLQEFDDLCYTMKDVDNS